MMIRGFTNLIPLSTAGLGGLAIGINSAGAHAAGAIDCGLGSTSPVPVRGHYRINPGIFCSGGAGGTSDEGIVVVWPAEVPGITRKQIELSENFAVLAELKPSQEQLLISRLCGFTVLLEHFKNDIVVMANDPFVKVMISRESTLIFLEILRNLCERNKISAAEREAIINELKTNLTPEEIFVVLFFANFLPYWLDTLCDKADSATEVISAFREILRQFYGLDTLDLKKLVFLAYFCIVAYHYDRPLIDTVELIKILREKIKKVQCITFKLQSKIGNMVDKEKPLPERVKDLSDLLDGSSQTDDAERAIDIGRMFGSFQ